MSRIWFYARVLVIAVSLCLTARAVSAGGIERQRPTGPVFDRYDADGQIRGALEPGRAGRLFGALRRQTPLGRSWPETMFSALAAASAELTRLSESGALADRDRPQVGAFVVLSIVELLVERHPELETRIESAFRATSDLSPIERLCGCDKRGSLACGCRVVSTGSGSCEYTVMCGEFVKAFCSVMSLELCIAETVFGIVT